jgi:hypothetical protein
MPDIAPQSKGVEVAVAWWGMALTLGVLAGYAAYT